MKRISPPDPPYLGPAKFHGGAQTLKPLKRIVIHGTVSPCVAGGARNIARYFCETITTFGSAHYVVDPKEVVQVVGDHQIAYHAPPNSESIGIEHCDPVNGPASRWDDANHTSMLKLSAATTARLCLAYDVPVRRIGPIQLKLGLRGITGHVDVSQTWRQSDHTDPGKDFPWGRYMSYVRAEVKRLKGIGDDPAVPAIPAVVPQAPSVKHMHLVTSNIKNLPDLTREQVLHDTKAVSALGGIIMWQEIAEQDDREDLATSLPASEWDHYNLDTEDPISVLRSNWTVLDHGSVLLHKGKAAVSPSRHVTWVKLARKGSTLPPVVVMNTHWVSGAFSHPGELEEAWRVEMWNVAHAAQAKLVQSFLAQGLTVLGGGDFNRTGTWDGFAPNHRWLMHGGFDHLWVCEAPTGMRVSLDLAGTLGLDELFTDHPARWVHVALLPPLPGAVHS